VVKPGTPMPTLEEVRTTASLTGLAKFKLPSRLLQWPHAQLPRGDTGKPLKRAVREWAVKALVAVEGEGGGGSVGPSDARGAESSVTAGSKGLHPSSKL
jgi:hypothetical protein